MAQQISSEVSEGIHELITNVTGFQNNSTEFITMQKKIHDKLKKSDTMYFLRKEELDRSISGMADKFNFHGFFSHAKALQEAYKGYISKNITKSELITRLNVVKLLLCMSEKPTAKFLENPKYFEIKSEPEEIDINWGEYLKEGIDISLPRYDEKTECSEWSSSEEEDDGSHNLTPLTNKMDIISSDDQEIVMNLIANREELLNTIQHTWYNSEHIYEKPMSDMREANIGILWEEYLQQETMGLVVIQRSNVISEYKVIREILWQLSGIHSSTVFCLSGNNLIVKNNITIPSSRPVTFQKFIQHQILPHIHLLKFFRDFSECMLVKSEESLISVPGVYRGYNCGIQNLIRSVYSNLDELEIKVRDQESNYTLIKFAEDLQTILAPIISLKKLHDEVVTDINSEENSLCASKLLVRLHNSLHFSTNKLDQDIRLTLYLESLNHFLTSIDIWFTQNDFKDYTEEFLIVNTTDRENCYLNFVVSDKIDTTIKNDSFLKLITKTALKIGRNLYLLRLLGDFSVVNENADSLETIYDEFVRRSLEELCKFFGHAANDSDIFSNKVNNLYTEEDDEEDSSDSFMYNYYEVCPENANKPIERDRLENLVDISDGFLMMAFEDYFKDQSKKPKVKTLTLYEKISKITTTFFPVTNFFEKILHSILIERFNVSGLRVKNILVERFMLDKQLQFFRHIYLFFDNIICPFYRRFFATVYSESKNWGNDTWLTFHLQDIILDIYPEFYQKCSVIVDKDWKTSANAIDVERLSIQIDVQWPLNLVINKSYMKLYKDIFNFILIVKWGLYKLNHLLFTDLEPKRSRYKHGKILHKKEKSSNKITIMKLQCLKFSLINLLTSIHHYIFSFIIAKCLQKFELDFEKANDLSSILSSHAEFIKNCNTMILEIKNCGKNNDSFNNVNVCINQLKDMWYNTETASLDRLDKTNTLYKECYNAVTPIISPVYLFDY